MELVKFLQQDLGTEDYPTKRALLRSAPYHLEIREEADLYNVMYSEMSPGIHEWAPIKNCVGTILQQGTDILVSYAFDRTTEVVVDIDKNADLIPADCSSYTFRKYVEGVKMTLYWHGGCWRRSTNRMIDASKAYWKSSTSFGDQFMDACRAYPEVLRQLEENSEEGVLTAGRTYIFVLSTPEVDMVNGVGKSSLLHVGTHDNKSCCHIECDIGVPKQETSSFDSREDVLAAMASMDRHSPGYIATGPRRFKIFSSAYAYARDLMGSSSDDVGNYLRIRRDATTRKDYLCFYPKHVALADRLEHELWLTARVVHHLYVHYFILHEQRPALPKSLYITLLQIHGEYMRTRAKRSLMDCYRHIDALPEHVQRALIAICMAPAL
jgi:hypothetical protein